MNTTRDAHGPDAEPTHADVEEVDLDCDCEGHDSEPSGVTMVDVPAPEAIVELCQQCVQYVQRASGLELDYTPETLPIVDHYLSVVRASTDERPALLHLVANATGAYFGELVRQRINGFWLLPSPDVHDWYVCAKSVYFRFNPIGAALEAIAQASEHSGPGAEFKVAREDQALIADRLAMVPMLPIDQYYLLSTRSETIDIIIETLRLSMDAEGKDSVEFEPEDYE